MKKIFSAFILSILFLNISLLLNGCASTYLKGVGADGNKIYVGPVPITNTEAYKIFIRSNKTEADKHVYILQRLKDAVDLEFYHDGSWYNSLQAYRGGMWLLRNRYQKGINTHNFVQKYIERSEKTGQYHLVKYPDGSIHIGSFVLYNELDLLEETLAKEGKTASS